MSGSMAIARRQFVHTLAGAAVAGQVLARQAPARPLIGIQFGAVSIADEGIEQVLDIFEERAGVNALFPAVFSYSGGTAGRQLRGHPFPGHGKQEPDATFRGGNFATVHPHFYRDTAIDARATQAPDHRGLDLLAVLIPPARKRGMKVIGLIQDSFPGDLPHIEQAQELDFNGQRSDNLCKNNPHYRNFMGGLVRDMVSSYDIDGLMFVCEQQGAFADMLGSRLRGRARGRPGSRTCFCDFCRQKAEAQGIRFDRVKLAFMELEKFAAAGRARKRPPDGYYATLWRLMLRYPELLAWEHFYHETLREVYQLLHSQVKSARPAAMFGPHIWHNFTFSPIYRAEQDFAELAKKFDFLKIAVYHNCGGARLASYIESVSDTIYGDIPPSELLDFHYRVLNYRQAPFDRVRAAALSADYVRRETQRAVSAAAEGGGGALMLAGIDIDIPVREEDLRGGAAAKPLPATREGARAAVRAAIQAGAAGIVLSRKYSEMRLETLSGAGDAVRELARKS